MKEVLASIYDRKAGKITARNMQTLKIAKRKNYLVTSKRDASFTRFLFYLVEVYLSPTKDTLKTI